MHASQVAAMVITRLIDLVHHRLVGNVICARCRFFVVHKLLVFV